MRLSPNLKRYIHWLGSALAVFSIVFVVIRLKSYYAQIDLDKLDGHAWVEVFGLSIFYGTSNLALSFAWLSILKQLGTVADRNWAIKTYGLTQLGKYLPGNIFHLAGRQGLGMAAGYPAWTLAKSTFWELAILCYAGALFGLLTLPLIFVEIPRHLAGAAFLLAVGFTLIAARRISRPDFAKAFCWYICFLAISGSLFYCLISQFADMSSQGHGSWPQLAGAFVIAWLAGLLTPGAPAGVGVRELALLLLLGSTVPEADLMLAVLLGRVVTVVGDLIFFAFAFLLREIVVAR